jgi:hypothetical protein
MYKLFQPEAIARANQSIWDADGEKVVTSSNLYLDQSSEICDDFDMLVILGITETDTRTHTKDIDRVERLFTGDDVTSVGSLFTQDSNTKQAEQVQNEASQHSITTPMRSVCTTLTKEDVEKELLSMSSEIATIKDMLQILTGKKIIKE